jgi:peptidylprolyl isomerase
MRAVSRGRLPIISLCLALALALSVAGCGSSGDDSSSTGATTAATTTESSGGDTNLNAKPKVTVPDGSAPKKLEEVEIVEGDGAEAKSGDEVTVQYVGVGYDSKEEFDSSWSRSEPFTFTLGAGEVIPGWDQGIVGMKIGGRRELTIPADLAYGPTGSPPVIGPNETLIFVVDLLAVE